MRGILTTSTILSGVGVFLGRLFFPPNILDVSDFIGYAYIFLKIGSDNVLISTGCDDM